MQEIVSQYPRLVAITVIAMALIVWMALVLSWLSGWRSLAKRYRTEREFPAHRRRMQTATMRGGIGYNFIVTLASDAEGLYLGLPAIFRLGQPPLFIPWADVSVDEPKQLRLVMLSTLWLGPDGIPLRVRTSLVEFLLAGKNVD